MGRAACTELQCLYKGELYLYLTHIEHSGKKMYDVKRMEITSPG